jgi:hypothetical protein
MMPLAAGIVSADMTFVAVRHEGLNSVPNQTSYKMAMGFNGGGSGKPPATGGASAAAQGGNCYCGVGGGPGLIKVSYN